MLASVPVADMETTMLRHVLQVLSVLALTCGGIDAEEKKESTDDHKSLQSGTWLCVEVYDDGKALDKALVQALDIRITFASDGTQTRTSGDDKWTMKWKIDTSKAPKQLDTEDKNGVWRGIYELDGDILKIARAIPRKDRPMKIEPGKGYGYSVFKRMK